MRIIALDFGEKSLGISISDSTNIIAIPMENFIFPKGNSNLPVKKVKEILSQNDDVKLILLGYPLRTDGKKSEITFKVDAFFNILKKEIKTKILLIDEVYSTQRGIELLKQNKNNKNNIKGMKDMAASYIILSDYLKYSNIKESK